MAIKNKSTAKVHVALAGAGGRMGSRVIRLISEFPQLRLTALLERNSELARLGKPDNIIVTDDPNQAVSTADVLIDFSVPSIVTQVAPICAEHNTAYLIATTGLDAHDLAAIKQAAHKIAVLKAANLSLGVNVLLDLVERTANTLGNAFEVEISEIHHRYKRDAPSGTALALGAAIERGRGTLKSVYGRHGIGESRSSDEIGYAALRGGDVAGEHTVFFFGENERIELTHRANSADIFARGALVATSWLAAKPAGRYTMRDVLHN
ncbi:MAG: 4-hydroxy-tetrahydrodipicolinate reductase [Deltaproteobacteria bacterium]|nr:4-hydroxy-tetrahydrodipicolinate reductase [Deltaproteobacteria bacterium]